MPADLPHLLNAINSGDSKAAENLLPLVHEELRRLAAQKMAHERPGQMLQATALVHEAWIKLAGSTDQQWKNRRHFFGAAAALPIRSQRKNPLVRIPPIIARASWSAGVLYRFVSVPMWQRHSSCHQKTGRTNKVE